MARPKNEQISTSVHTSKSHLNNMKYIPWNQFNSWGSMFQVNQNYTGSYEHYLANAVFVKYTVFVHVTGSWEF